MMIFWRKFVLAVLLTTKLIDLFYPFNVFLPTVYQTRSVINVFMEMFKCNQVIHCVQKELTLQVVVIILSDFSSPIHSKHRKNSPQIQVSKVSRKTFKLPSKENGESGRKRGANEKIEFY